MYGGPISSRSPPRKSRIFVKDTLARDSGRLRWMLRNGKLRWLEKSTEFWWYLLGWIGDFPARYVYKYWDWYIYLNLLLMVQKSCTDWYGEYLIIYRVLYIPGGCLGFLPSTVFTKKEWFLWHYSLPEGISNRIVTFENSTPFSTLDSVSLAVHVIFHPSTPYLISVLSGCNVWDLHLRIYYISNTFFLGPLLWYINHSGHSTETSTVNIRCATVIIKAFPPDLFFVDIGFFTKITSFQYYISWFRVELIVLMV